MAPSGKSKRGRGGGAMAGKSDHSRNRVSSASSTPTTAAASSPQSVTLPRPPTQYPSASQDPEASAPQHVFHPPAHHPRHVQASGSQTSTPQPHHQVSHIPLPQLNPHHTPPLQPLTQPNPVEDQQDEDDDDDANDHHQAGGHMSLDALLTMQGRGEFLETISPNEGEGLWFDRDETVLVNKISKILQDKFDGPYYSWSVTPSDVQDRFFVQLAHRYTWDPVITPLVREQFDEIAQRRLKGMISYVRTTRKRPNWIRKTLWTQMEAFWNTDDAKRRSATASTSRNSPRDGLGPHKHVSGPKSHAQIQRDMVREEGRDVSIAEVFIRTHTRKDGSYVDEKARKIGETYEQNLQASQSQLEVDVSMTSDGASQAPELTTEQKNAIFLESTIVDDRGNPYGLGRLSRVHGKGKKPIVLTSSSAIVALEEKLKEAETKMAEQAEQNKLQMELLVKYLKEKDPNLPSWIVSQGTTPLQPATGLNGEANDTNTPSSSHTTN